MAVTHRQITDLTVLNTDPRDAIQTVYAAAAVMLGFKFSSDQPFYHELEKVGDDQYRRRVTWTFLDEVAVIAGERMDFKTFWEKITDSNWLMEHPDHPITVARKVGEAVQNLLGEYVPGKGGLVNSPPILKLPGRIEGTFAYLPVNATEEERAELLQDFELAD